MDQHRASREQTRKGTHGEELNAGAPICQILMILMLRKLFGKKIRLFCRYKISFSVLRFLQATWLKITVFSTKFFVILVVSFQKKKKDFK